MNTAKPAQSSPAPAKPKPDGNFFGLLPAPDPAAVARGQGVFVANCGFCHGSGAKGGATGPSLVRSVLVLHDEGKGEKISEVILNGRPSKGMPKFNLTDAQIKDIAAFLLSRNQAVANRMEYKLQNLVTGDAMTGHIYFDAHCASCHSSDGDLAHVAQRFEPVDLQSRFLYPEVRRRRGVEPDNATSKAETTVTVTLASGKSYVGKLDQLDDFSVSLSEPSGEYHSWLFEAETGIKVDVHNPLQGHADLLKTYTDADMHNVLAYLETLK